MSCTPYRKNFVNSLPFSNVNFNALLEAATVLSWTVPGSATQKYRVKFRCSYSVEIWVGYNVAPVDPTSDTATNNPYQELVPLDECRYVKGGDTLQFLAPTGTPRISAQLLLTEDTTSA